MVFIVDEAHSSTFGDMLITIKKTLQLFWVARIGYRVVSRVLMVMVSYLGLSKTPCSQRIPAFCGKLTRQDVDNVLNMSVKEERERVGTMPSLIRQHREVFSQGGCIESIKSDDEKPNLELIIGSKTG